MIMTIAKRFEAILSELDALAEACDSAEALEDLNAEFEDTLLMLSELNPSDEGYQEELDDIMEDLRSLADDYRALARDIPGVEALADRLKRAAKAECSA